MRSEIGDSILVIGLPLLMVLCILGYIFATEYMWIGQLLMGLALPGAIFMVLRGCRKGVKGGEGS